MRIEGTAGGRLSAVSLRWLPQPARPSRQAADACRGAIAGKLGAKSFSLDRGDMAKRARDESPEVVAIASTIVFDKGLSTEYSQTFDCRVRLENGKPASVIGLQFNWNKDDLKNVNADTGG